MPEPDARFTTYLEAFFSDLLTGMSGPLSVPFAALALWVSSRTQKILWGGLAALCALFASYLVWRKERINGSVVLGTLRTEKDAQILALNQRVAELSRKPYSEDLERHVRQALGYQMTLSGHYLLRWLLIHRRIECDRQFIPEISLETQNREMEIAVEAGIVQREQEQSGLMRTYYIVNPELKPVLERVLPEMLDART